MFRIVLIFSYHIRIIFAMALLRSNHMVLGSNHFCKSSVGAVWHRFLRLELFAFSTQTQLKLRWDPSSAQKCLRIISYNFDNPPNMSSNHFVSLRNISNISITFVKAGFV